MHPWNDPLFELPSLDEARLKALTTPEMGGKDFFVELSAMFFEQTSETLEEFGRALQARDEKNIIYFAHKIKGFCRNIGVHRLATVLCDLERHPKKLEHACNDASLAWIKSELDRVKAELLARGLYEESRSADVL
jgi:HPt (histidine-containing phosphotransfer) domain-containing protein